MDEDKMKSGCAFTGILYFVIIVVMIVLWAVFLTKPMQ